MRQRSRLVDAIHLVISTGRSCGPITMVIALSYVNRHYLPDSAFRLADWATTPRRCRTAVSISNPIATAAATAIAAAPAHVVSLILRHAWLQPSVEAGPAVQMAAARYDRFRYGFEADVAVEARVVVGMGGIVCWWTELRCCRRRRRRCRCGISALMGWMILGLIRHDAIGQGGY